MKKGIPQTVSYVIVFRLLSIGEVLRMFYYSKVTVRFNLMFNFIYSDIQTSVVTRNGCQMKMPAIQKTPISPVFNGNGWIFYSIN